MPYALLYVHFRLCGIDLFVLLSIKFSCSYLLLFFCYSLYGKMGMSDLDGIKNYKCEIKSEVSTHN